MADSANAQGTQCVGRGAAWACGLIIRRNGIAIVLAVIALFGIEGSAQAVLTEQFMVFGSTVPADGSVAADGKATFTINPTNQTITLVLTNLTIDPLHSCQLLTGIDFTVGNTGTGAIKNLQLEAAYAYGRTINSDGTYWDTKTPVNLLNPASWEMDDNQAPASLGYNTTKGQYNAAFQPNAQYGVIGAPDAQGLYTGNYPVGQTPFAAQSITLVFGAPSGIGSNTSISQVCFGFGTNFETTLISPVPEGNSLFVLLGLVGTGLGVRSVRRFLAARRARREELPQLEQAAQSA